MITRSAADPPGPRGDARLAPPAPAPIARHGRLPVQPVSITLLKGFAVAVAVVLVSAATVTGIAIGDVTSSLKAPVALPADSNGPVPEIGAIEGGVNLLLVGSDSGQGDPRFGPRGEHLGDVTVLLHISQDHTAATVISFPRDLQVDIPACSASPDESAPGTDGGFTDKLNAALSYGGLGCTVAVVQQLSGLTIPFAAEIEFNGVIEMSNAVGGVPVCVAEPIQDEYTGTFLTAGEHVLSGWDALQFLRTRHGLSTGSDLARIGNQQAFLASLMRTITSEGTLNNPLTLYSLAKAAASNMRLSTSLQSLDSMVSIAKALQDVTLEQMVFVQYPVDEMPDGLMGRTDDAAALFAALAADQPIQLGGQLGPASEQVPPASPAPIASPAPSSPDTIAPTGTPTSAAPAAPPTAPAVVLPPSITGQTAADRTCTVGRSLSDQ
ncbi:LCP family protein [Leifsonia sp. YAF41]|uniref:LCP family protein n=1 Tax=Leifsonia sp. YAF41 TaxID=3233086 RepID=UPI003F95B327